MRHKPLLITGLMDGLTKCHEPRNVKDRGNEDDITAKRRFCRVLNSTDKL